MFRPTAAYIKTSGTLSKYENVNFVHCSINCDVMLVIYMLKHSLVVMP